MFEGARSTDCVQVNFFTYSVSGFDYAVVVRRLESACAASLILEKVFG